MDNEEIQLHYRAARHYGEASACGEKIRFSEKSAINAVYAMSKKVLDKQFEYYPCPFCGHFHDGRKMTQEERDFFK